MNTHVPAFFLFLLLFVFMHCDAAQMHEQHITDQQVRQLVSDAGIDLDQVWKEIVSTHRGTTTDEIEQMRPTLYKLIETLRTQLLSFLSSKTFASLNQLFDAAGIKSSKHCTTTKRQVDRFSCSVCNEKICCGIKASKHSQTQIVRIENENVVINDFLSAICSLIGYHLEHAINLHQAHGYSHDLTQLPMLGILVSTAQGQPLFVSGNLDAFLAQQNNQEPPQEQLEDFYEELRKECIDHQPTCLSTLITFFRSLVFE